MQLGEQSTAQAQAFVNLATKALRMTSTPQSRGLRGFYNIVSKRLNDKP
jgi:hypothetical protein